MAKGDSTAIISARAVTKIFGKGELGVRVLEGIDLTVQRGEMVAIMGKSGSGKSSLLNILGGLDRATSGTVKIAGLDTHSYREGAMGRIRNRYLGFIYQFHHLLPEFTALENVAMPLFLGHSTMAEIKPRARAMLAAVGLAKREKHRLGELSGGERQRVAIARALVNNPSCVLADEPTGNLDSQTAQQIYELIFNLREEFHTAFVLVTHDSSLVTKMMKVLVLENGKLTNFIL